MSKKVIDIECCPPFDPVPWDDKEFEWDNKLFIKGKVCTLFYIPLNFGSVMKKLNRTIDNAKTEMLDWMSLSAHTSQWNMDLYLAVDKEISGAENIKITGRFYSRVYEGSFNETGKWSADFEEKAKAKGLQPGKQYMWYTTCPKCAKKYGKNYVVIIGKI
ncbi:MAG TPA: hypothetical protein P5084_09230 [Paludibacter sp.]|nr:hypothetical protein [Paludibacter sp.]